MSVGQVHLVQRLEKDVKSPVFQVVFISNILFTNTYRRYCVYVLTCTAINILHSFSFVSQDGSALTIVCAATLRNCRSNLLSHPQYTDTELTRGWYHRGRRLSNVDSFHSPTVIPPSALDKLSIMKRYHCRRRCSHTSPHCSPMMVTLHDIGFVECRWWNDGWTVKTVVTWRLSASMTPAPVLALTL